MGRNNYLEQRDAVRREFFIAGMELEGQRTIDMLCLVLHDPEIMGKDTFGKDRIKMVIRAVQEREQLFKEAFLHTQETDWYQEKLDDALRDIFGEIDPFNKRYPYQKKWNYNKIMK